MIPLQQSRGSETTQVGSFATVRGCNCGTLPAVASGSPFMLATCFLFRYTPLQNFPNLVARHRFGGCAA